jgi:hypothetical protein
MVIEGMRQMFLARYGGETWERIRNRAGCGEEHFLRMESYPEDLPYRLVGAAAEELALPADELLHRFGEYWVPFAQASGYSDFFRACDSYAEFLLQLDAMHARLEIAFPDFRPPQFTCRVDSPERIEVIYRSHREGLAPFVHGLLEALGAPFGVNPAVEHPGGKAPGSGGAEERFIITLS